MHSAIVGLGGRPVPKASLHRLFRQAAIQPWEGPHFLTSTSASRQARSTGAGRRGGRVRRRRASSRSSNRSGSINLRKPRDERGPEAQVLPEGNPDRRQSAGERGRAQRAGEPRPLQLADFGPSRLPGLRRGARRALRASMWPCAPPSETLSPSTRPVVSKFSNSPRPIRRPPGRFQLGRTSAVGQRSGGRDRGSGGDAGHGQNPRASSPRAATAARPTSASAASRACSSATTTCSTSATTTKAT